MVCLVCVKGLTSRTNIIDMKRFIKQVKDNRECYISR